MCVCLFICVVFCLCVTMLLCDGVFIRMCVRLCGCWFAYVFNCVNVLFECICMCLRVCVCLFG